MEHLREDEQAMLLRCDSIQKQFDGAEVRMLLSRLSECRAHLQVEQDNCGRLLAKLAAAESREATLREQRDGLANALNVALADFEAYRNGRRPGCWPRWLEDEIAACDDCDSEDMCNVHYEKAAALSPESKP